MQLLTDRFGRVHDYIRISVTDRCNLRCVYCMPDEGMTFLPHEQVLSKNEIVDFMKIMVGYGIKKSPDYRRRTTFADRYCGYYRRN